MKVSKKIFYLILKKEALLANWVQSERCCTENDTLYPQEQNSKCRLIISIEVQDIGHITINYYNSVLIHLSG